MLKMTMQLPLGGGNLWGNHSESWGRTFTQWAINEETRKQKGASCVWGTANRMTSWSAVNEGESRARPG